MTECFLKYKGRARCGEIGVSLLKIMWLMALLLCSLPATVAATNEDINRYELCNRVCLEQNDNEMINRCCIPEDKVIGQNDPKMIDFGGYPHYVLVTHTTDHKVDKNSEFIMYLYIEGGGNVNYSEIVVSIPYYIAKDKIIYLTTRECSQNHGNVCFYYSPPRLMNPRFNVYPSKNIYIRVESTGYDDRGTSQVVKKLIGAVDVPTDGINPPFIINFTVDNDAPEGDHDIVLAYIYTDSDKWYVQKDTIKLHVNYWYETKFYQYLLTAVAILSIIYFVHYLYVLLKRVLI